MTQGQLCDSRGISREQKLQAVFVPVQHARVPHHGAPYTTMRTFGLLAISEARREKVYGRRASACDAELQLIIITETAG